MLGAIKPSPFPCRLSGGYMRRRKAAEQSIALVFAIVCPVKPREHQNRQRELWRWATCINRTEATNTAK